MSAGAVVIIVKNPKGKNRTQQANERVEIEVESELDLSDADLLRAAADELEDRDG